MKKTKKSRKGRSGATQQASGPQGFDFGFVPTHMLVSESDQYLNTAFRDANVMACAYGYDRAPGYPEMMPCITLVAEHPNRLKDAFDILAQWGSQEDGDCVDINVLLRKNGSYLFSVGASPDRIVDRWNVGSLIDPIFFNMSWIKTFDTTNPILHEWAEKIVPPLTPIKIRGATADFRKGSIPDISTIEDIVDNKNFTKLHLKIETEISRPDHWLITIKDRVRKSNSGLPKKKPRDISRARSRIIDTAFPVTRERIRHSDLIEGVKRAWGASPPSDAQIIQAAINLCIAQELSLGTHFPSVSDLKKVWWNYVQERVEVCAKPRKLPDLPIEDVIKQIELDTRQTLVDRGMHVSALSRSAMQKQFVKLGYADA